MLGLPKNSPTTPAGTGRRTVRVALAGNPNSGKTTLFNAITGSHQRVANYPGVTVERKHGFARFNGCDLEVTDLPGLYDLTPGSIDERVASESLLREPPDVVVGVIDCTNLERNLYLAVQLRELGTPLVLAFTMSDLATARGIRFDLDALSARLGAPIVPVVGHRAFGITTLLDQVVQASSNHNGDGQLDIDYGPEVEAELTALRSVMVTHNGHIPEAQHRWHAVKLLEDDPVVLESVASDAIGVAAAAGRLRVRERTGVDAVHTITSRRYQFISDACAAAVDAPPTSGDTLSDRLDRVLTHRVVGLPIFFASMFVVFQLTFTLANPMANLIETFFAWLGTALVSVSPLPASSPVMSLLVDGVIGGVGGVLVFVPNIVMLFLAISILEDSGYMARAAFMMDRLMSKAGLHGKSFIPMLLGVGCSVPAIMATRTLDSHRDRLTTMLVVPLMSCSARLTIYALIIPAFFAPQWQGPVLWLMYVIGIVLAISVANILRSTFFAGEKSAFLMELPPYHVPSRRTIVMHVRSRAWLYMRKAGTVILGVSILLWAMTAFPRQPAPAPVDPAASSAVADPAADAGARADRLSYSIVGRIGHAMEPVIRPMGFDWKIGTALVGAFAAKEVFVAQMGIVYAVGEGSGGPEALRDRLRMEYPALVGFCILLFALIATPCMATVAIMRRESNSWRWAFVQFGSLTLIGYALTTLAYQVGRLLGIGI